MTKLVLTNKTWRLDPEIKMVRITLDDGYTTERPCFGIDLDRDRALLVLVAESDRERGLPSLE